MKFNELKITKNRKPDRVGRGIAAGKGKTAGRGTKGQGSRKSGGVRPGFEGGQTPLYMRIPKLKGFRSVRPKCNNVYTGQINALGKAKIDNYVLAEAGLVESPFTKVKLISNGAITKKIDVKLQAASLSAVAQLEKVGGSFEKVEQQKRPAKKQESKSTK